MLRDILDAPTAPVARTFDAAAVNAVCNDPAVHPTLGLGKGVIDVSALIADTRNVIFLGEFGGAAFHRSAPGIFGAHDFFLPAGRGAWALAASRYMLREMFRSFGAKMIWAETPSDNRACRMFNRLLGFTSHGETIAPLYVGGPDTPIETFTMEAAPCR